MTTKARPSEAKETAAPVGKKPAAPAAKKSPTSKPSTNPFVEQHPSRMGRPSQSGSKGSHRGGR